MTLVPAEAPVWLAGGVTDMREGFNGLAALAASQLMEGPHSGQIIISRGCRGDVVKISGGM